MLNRIQLSLRTAIFIVFFVLSALTILGVLFIQFYRENDTLNVMSERIIDTRSRAVSNALNYYIHTPQQANNIASIFIKTLDTTDKEASLRQIGDYLYTIMRQTFSREALLSSIAFGSINGDYIGFSRDVESNWTFQIKKSAQTNNRLLFFKDASDLSPVTYAQDHYDLFTRPWFKAVNQSHQAMWSSAYRDVDSESNISISFSSPVLNKAGQYIGVLSSDLHLSRMNRFLASLTTAEHSLIYLVNDKDQILAASSPTLLQGKKDFGLAEQSGTDLPMVKDSADPAVKATAQFLQSGNETIQQININDVRYFSKVIRIDDSLNLRGWHMVILVPENDLGGHLSSYRNMTILIAIIIFLLGCLIAHRILSFVVNPLKNIAEHAPDIARRNKLKLDTGWSFREISTLNTALNKMSEDLDTTFVKLERQINIDAETNLFTRKGLMTHLQDNGDVFYGVVGILSLSNLQTMINNLGKSYASRYMEEFLKFLKRHFPENVIIAREAVDRFIICYPGNHLKERQENIARMMNLIHTAEHEYDHSRYVFTGYIGVVDCQGEVSLDNAISRASIAHLAARVQENGNSRLYDDALREQALKNISILNHLYGAIPNDELFLVYQPIIQLGHSKIKEAECLVRWRNDELGMVPPDLFIGVAEESGFIVQLGRWIIAKACHTLASRIQEGLCIPDFKLHINISIVELAQIDFCEYLLSVIQLSGLKNTNICIEITETSMIKGDDLLKSSLSTLRLAGVSVSIDDFGSGFSSLSYLHKLEFDALKIDRNFVMDILNNKKSESIISAVILLAKGFNVPLIAEGVETKEVADKLQSMGCEKAQGYYFCRPIPFEEWPVQDIT